MTTAEIANDLVALCRMGRNMEAIDKHYAPSIVSVEAAAAPGMPAEMAGLDAIKKKNEYWMMNNQVHRGEANGPFVGDGQFAVEFKYEITPKGSDQRRQMNEMAVYTVADGKIVHERFYYNAGA